MKCLLAVLKTTAWSPGVTLAAHALVVGTVAAALTIARRGGPGRLVVCALVCAAVFAGAARMFPWWWVGVVVTAGAAAWRVGLAAVQQRGFR